jgi:hypothetical protein
MRTNAWEGKRKELKIERKFYVRSRDVRMVCPRFRCLLSDVKADVRHAGGGRASVY